MRQPVTRLACFLGLLSVSLYNWHRWGKDKAVLAQAANPPPVPAPDRWRELPLVSVLVAAWNETENVEQHIHSFLTLRYRRKELILCAGGNDGTYRLARRYQGRQVTILRQQDGEGKQRALARSLTLARGDIIFLTDADCFLDDEAFERTLFPVASGEEEACSGSSRPQAGQMSNPFVVAQAASDIYSSLQGREYASGLLGRNCAVRRSLLEASRGLEVYAPAGTDYVLAKEMLNHGARICHEPHSRVVTRYPDSLQEYVRQQRRWLRSVVLHGRRYRASVEVRASLCTSLIGAVMLLLPLVGLLIRPWLLLAWGLLLVHALLARLRYLHFVSALLERRLHLLDLVWQGPQLLLDFVAWTQPLADYVQKRNFWKW